MVGIRYRSRGPQPLRHPDDGLILGQQRLVFAERAFRDHDRLREVGGIDDDELRTGGRGKCEQDEDDKDGAAHDGSPYGIRASSDRPAVSGGSYAGRSRSLVR
jgi:hypothetical protein